MEVDTAHSYYLANYLVIDICTLCTIGKVNGNTLFKQNLVANLLYIAVFFCGRSRRVYTNVTGDGRPKTLLIVHKCLKKD